MHKSPATLALEKRRDELTAHIVKLSGHAWLSVAEDVSNVGMIVGTDGIIIIDTGMIQDCARSTLEKFREIAPRETLPVKAIIYTHGHGDHTGGSAVFFEEGDKPAIWARSNFGAEAAPFERSGLMPVFKARGARQGGFQLPPERRICNGIAPVRYPRAGGAIFSGRTGAVPPDHFFSGDSTVIHVAGIELWLFATPGETEDALSVWFPDEKVLFCGDDLYRSFPNVYPVRGTGSRDIASWCQSLSLMDALEPEVLAPGHTDPFFGKDHVHTVLGNYREALEYVLHASIDGINAGMTPDQLAEEVRLPEHLAGLDYLQEYYGNVAWTVRNIFNQYLGWFDGNPLHLCSAFTPREEALHILAMAGGKGALRRKAKTALEQGDAPWAARLADHLLAIDPDKKEFLLLKAEALEVMAESMLTATGRNYTLTTAQQLREAAERL